MFSPPDPPRSLVRRDINHVEHILKLPLISPLLRTRRRRPRPPLPDWDGQQHLRRRGPRDEFSLGAPLARLFGECGANVS